MPWIRQHQIDSFFQTFRVLCSRIEYAEKPVDELFKNSEAFHDVKIFEILEWLAFTGVQITTLPPDFYLGSALSVLVRSWNTPMTNENLIIHRALVKKGLSRLVQTYTTEIWINEHYSRGLWRVHRCRLRIKNTLMSGWAFLKTVRLTSVTISCKSLTSLTSIHSKLTTTPLFELPKKPTCQTSCTRKCTHALIFA